MNNSKEDIRELIDSDGGLRSKRKMLTITSLLLLAIQFSGAKVIEANTFVLKLSFTHQNGIALLLLLAVVFLLIRYFNYARPYHVKLYKIWTSRMLQSDFFISHCPYSDEVDGLIMNLVPEEMNIDPIHQDERCGWGYTYRCRCFLRRYIDYSWYDENHDNSKMVSLFQKTKIVEYLKILRYELKYQLTSFFSYRENLDIMAPYLIGVLAINSYIFDDEVHRLIEFLTVAQ